MKLELFIAVRYLKARRKGVFTLLTTLIAVGGITLGVASLIVTLAVMTGFHRDISEKILGVQPHIVIIKNGAEFSEFKDVEKIVRENAEIESISPFVYGQIILRNKNASTGVILKGVNLKDEAKLANLSTNIVKNSSGFVTLETNEIIVGKELSKNLGISVGEDVILTAPGNYTFIPRMEKFRVSGIFHSGMYEYDSNLAYISIDSARKIFGMKDDSVSGLGVSLKNFEKTGFIEKTLQKELSYPYLVRSWQTMNRNLFAALKLEKIMMFIILTLIIIVAAFNIISNLVLLTVEKSREIGIMSALGFTRKSIASIFFYEGLIIGLAGVVSGLGLGVAICFVIKKYKFISLPADVYYLDTLPVVIVPQDVITVIAATILITVLAGIYPAYQVSKLNPLDAIRYG